MKVCRREVAALVREDRGEHRDAEDAAELAQRVVRARGLALLLPAHRREHDVRDRREEEPHADARDDERGDEARVRDGRRDDRGQPAERDRLQREPGRHERPAADRGRTACPRPARRASSRPSRRASAGRRRARCSPARSGGTASAGRSSRTCRSTSRPSAPFAAENARLRKKRSGSIGAFERASIQTNTPMISDAADDEAEHLGRAPAERVRAHDAPDDAEQADDRDDDDRECRACRPGPSSRGDGSTRAGS